MSNGWDTHLERHAAIGAVFDITAWERMIALTERNRAVLRATIALLEAQLNALAGAVTEQEAEMVAVLHALGQAAAPSDLRSGPAAPPTGWDDGVHDFQQHLVAANAAADEVRHRAGLQPRKSYALRETDAGDAQMYAEGWQGACVLYDSLTAGASLQPVRFDSGEAVYFDEWLMTGTFSTVVYQGDLPELLQLAVNVRPGDVEAPAWGSGRVVLTDRRTLFQRDDTWYACRHTDGVRLAPDVTRASVVVQHGDGAPLLLRGPSVPAFAVMLASLAHGTRGLGLAGFAPLVMAAAGRSRWVSGSGGAA